MNTGCEESEMFRVVGQPVNEHFFMNVTKDLLAELSAH